MFHSQGVVSPLAGQPCVTEGTVGLTGELAVTEELEEGYLIYTTTALYDPYSSTGEVEIRIDQTAASYDGATAVLDGAGVSSDAARRWRAEFHGTLETGEVYNSCYAQSGEEWYPSGWNTLSASFSGNITVRENVPAEVVFDDPAAPGVQSGCQVVGFTVYDKDRHALPERDFSATSTTAASTDALREYSGVTDASGRGYIDYCPPAGVNGNPLEVTFTASALGPMRLGDVWDGSHPWATGTAIRTWEPAGVCSNVQIFVLCSPAGVEPPGIPPSLGIPPELSDAGAAASGETFGLVNGGLAPSDSCKFRNTGYVDGGNGGGDRALYAVDTKLGAYALAYADTGWTNYTKREATAFAVAGHAIEWSGGTDSLAVDLSWLTRGEIESIIATLRPGNSAALELPVRPPA